MKLSWACAVTVWLAVIFSAGFALAAIAHGLGMSWDVALPLALPLAATMSFVISTRRRQPQGETMVFAGIRVRMYFRDDPSAAVLGWQAPRRRRGDSLGEGLITQDGTAPRRVIIVWSERRNIIEGFDQPLRMSPGDQLDVQFSRDGPDESRVSRVFLSRSVRTGNE